MGEKVSVVENDPKEECKKRGLPPAVPATGISVGIAVVDTAVIAALTGFTLPAAACVGIGAGIFAISFTAIACCSAAGRADEKMG